MDSATNLVTGSGFNDPSVRTYLNSENARYIIREFMSSAPIEEIEEFKSFMSKSSEEIQAERDEKVLREKREYSEMERKYLKNHRISNKRRKKFIKKHPEYADMIDDTFKTFYE